MKRQSTTTVSETRRQSGGPANDATRGTLAKCVPIKETPGAFFFAAETTDGRALTITVPKNVATVDEAGRTSCCGAMSTYHDATLICKACFNEVEIAL